MSLYGLDAAGGRRRKPDPPVVVTVVVDDEPVQLPADGPLTRAIGQLARLLAHW
jgi:hypothetical protein